MPEPLHVLLSAYACLPDAGTEPGNGWNWALHLAARGIRVHVLTVTDGRDAIEAFMARHPELPMRFSYVEVSQRLRHPSPLHYVRWQWSAVEVARKLHRRDPVDLVHHVTYSSIHVPTQLWRLGAPTIFGPVGGGQITPKGLLDGFGRGRRSEVLRSAFTRLLPYSPWHRASLRHMAVVLATNRDTLRLAWAMGNADAAPWFDAALPTSFFAETPRVYATSAEPLRVLWIGRMVPRKGLPLALDALANTQRPATLTLGGDGVPEAEVRRMIADRGLTERVHWEARRLTRTEVRQAYRTHDALLLTSLRDSCPAQALEAMAMGLPVITLDLHGAHDLVPPEAGIKVPVSTLPGTAHDLGAAIDRFAELSGERRTAMSAAAWSFARTLDYAAGAELFEALYRQILASAPELTALPRSAQHMRMADAVQ